MLPAINHPVWTEIVIGKKTIQTEKTAVNLMIQSSRISYGRSPSIESLALIIAKMHSFFTRYESTFANEIAQILR